MVLDCILRPELNRSCDGCDNEWRTYKGLHVLLRDWVPKTLVYGGELYLNMFYTRERLRRIIAEYNYEGWRS
jgi:hypothetical protein